MTLLWRFTRKLRKHPTYSANHKFILYVIYIADNPSTNKMYIDERK